ncbi:MAG: PadR family transcriptional regulator [Candidatus Altiarchaeota archaeon]|nr:PadR family transcriptional regulator [Candidatus Altiarchaeota archaeon]
MPLNRLKEKTTTECLWLYLLSLMKDEPMYAYEIRERIQEKFGFTIGNVTAYLVLYKLEQGGYVKTEWLLRDNRQRKYYTITPKGRKTLEEGISYLHKLASKLKK